jgi:hypothetical protein
VPQQDTTPLLLACAGAALCFGAWCGLALAARRARRRMARSRRAGRRGESRALRLLRRRGYRVLAREVRAKVRVRVDGRTLEYDVRADALVRRWWRRYVVEIKTGGSATPANRATRRQLLEYACAFRCRGVLLVDADGGRIRRVEFGLPGRGA